MSSHNYRVSGPHRKKYIITKKDEDVSSYMLKKCRMADKTHDHTEVQVCLDLSLIF